MKRLFSVRQVMRQFFKPLFKCPIRMLSISVIISIILYIGIDIIVSEFVRQNSNDIHILAAEIIHEFDPDAVDQIEHHIEMIEQFAGHLERRRAGFALRWLYPQYSLDKQMASSLVELKAANTNEDAQKAIRKAGKTALRLYKKGEKFPKSPKAWFDSEKLPEELTKDINDSLAEATKMANNFESVMNEEAAIASCRAHRRGILLLSLGQLGYNDKEKIQQFLNDVRRARDCARDLADKTGNELIYNVAKSEDRRVKILEAMLEGDTREVCVILRDAIEMAFFEERKSGNDPE